MTKWIDGDEEHRRYPKVILYSTSLHAWEVWRQGRPIGQATHWQTLKRHFPAAEGPSDAQLRLAEGDQT